MRIATTILIAACAAPAWAQDVTGSLHNLSASGPGSVKSATETEVCVFCHTPHNATPRAPLWNRRDPGGAYTPYTSTTVLVAPGQPTGASRQCLSCHDGTIALGEVTSRSTEIAMSSRLMPAGRSRLGTDISDDHPVSIDYQACLGNPRAELRANPSVAGRTALDPQGLVQCTSCHDPHDDRNGSFLRVAPVNGALCTSCHAPAGWTGSTHATSVKTWNGTGTDPWPRSPFTTVAANACESCHSPHAAPGRSRLLSSALEEQVCLVCHSGTVAARNLAPEFSKLSRHSVAATSGVHDPLETPGGTKSHAECADCHDQHRTTGTAGGGNGTNTPLPGSLAGVSGLTISGSVTTSVSFEYELCFKCHSDGLSTYTKRIPRVATQPDIRLKFTSNNPSFHPVAAAGTNPDVPSLLTTWTTASRTKCSDCHSNNSGPGAGGTGPRGPHGSIWEPILERRYDTGDPVTESSAAYALCYKCHSRTSILGNTSFREHNKHIVGENTSCSVCHDPHGIAASQQGAGANRHLINFDTRVVRPNSSGRLEFIDQGRFRGTCYLTCHGENHNPESY